MFRVCSLVVTDDLRSLLMEHDRVRSALVRLPLLLCLVYEMWHLHMREAM